MKKTYVQPALCVVRTQTETLICTSGMKSIKTMSTNLKDVSVGGVSSDYARVKQNDYNVWDDDWSN